MSLKVGWFSTGKDKQARALLRETQKAIKQGKIGEIHISYVFSNREREESRETDKFIQLVSEMGLPFTGFSSRKFKPRLRKRGLGEAKKGNFELINQWRVLYDRKIIKAIQGYPTEVIFLAGYMLILGDELCEKFPILNLHPALPGGPKGTWQEVIWELIRKKDRQTGVMIHRVTPELDAGPAVAYCRFPLREGRFDCLWEKMGQKLKYKTLAQIQREEGEKEPLFQAIREEQKKREIPLVLATLRLLTNRKLNLQNLKEPLLIKL